MPIVGSFAGASARAYGLGAGLGAPIGYNSIATITVGTATPSVEFTAIPQTFTHLQIRAIGRNSASGGYDAYLQFNGVTSAVYSYHYLYSTGSGAITAGVDTTQGFVIGLRLTTPTETANNFGTGVIDILDYKNTNKFKSVRTLSGFNNNGGGFNWQTSGNWRSTSAITSLKLIASVSGNFAVNSTFALYGIEG